VNSLKGTRITWLGHATVLVQTASGTNILIDPFIAQNPKYPKHFKLPETIHYVLLTHGHSDHISDVVPVAARHDSTVVAIYELAAYVAAKGVARTIGMNLGGTVQLDGVAVTMVEAKHSSGAEDEQELMMSELRPAMCSPSRMAPCFTTPEIPRYSET